MALAQLAAAPPRALTISAIAARMTLWLASLPIVICKGYITKIGAKGSKLCGLTQRGPELVSIKNSPGSSDGSAGFRSPLAGICQSGNNPLSDHRSFELRHRPMIVNIALPIVLLVTVEQRTYIDARSTLSCSRQSELDHLSTFRPVPMETNFGEPSFCFWNRMEQS